MGAEITSNNHKLPIVINGKQLHSIKYLLEIPSAQVKSGIMLAALFAKNKTEIIEKQITRNHTEIMLESFNADINVKKKDKQNHIYINGQKELSPKNINILVGFSFYNGNIKYGNKEIVHNLYPNIRLICIFVKILKNA